LSVARRANDPFVLTDADRARQKLVHGSEKMFVAIYDYDARTDEDLTFHVGDLLFIIDDRFDATSNDVFASRTRSRFSVSVRTTGGSPSIVKVD
jgi:hypothetical protein